MFPFATFKDGNALRATSKTFLECTKGTSFCDKKAVNVCVKKWRTCFPMAKHLVLEYPLHESVVPLSHLETLVVDTMCGQYAKMVIPNRLQSVVLKNICDVDDDLFALLAGIPQVELDNVRLTDGVLHLVGVQELTISSWKYFKHLGSISQLTGLRVLKLSISNYFTDEMFSMLKNLQLEELRITGDYSDRERFTDLAFLDMVGIHTVELKCARHLDFLRNISKKGFKALGGHQTLEFCTNAFEVGLKFGRVEGVDNSAKTWGKVLRPLTF